MLKEHIALGWRAWARNRSLGTLFAITAVCCILIAFTSDIMISLPPLLSWKGVEVSNAAVIPLLVVVVQGWCLSRRDPRAELGSVRRIAYADCLLSMTPAVLFAVLSWSANLPLGMISTRNIIGLAGLTLLSHAIGIKKLSAIPAVTWVLASLLLGRTESYTARWSWPIKDRTDALSAIMAGTLCLLGIFLSLARARRAM
ncbi:hypothetical protein [Cutibacterium sp.]|uniref:hypothetical protein n=1 Tax=Cutibacterium sp. TaxID=1912221 RepID=UPI0034C5E228